MSDEPDRPSRSDRVGRPDHADRSTRDGRSDRSSQSGVSTPRELLVVAALLVVPIAVVPASGEDLAVVSLWGLLTTGSNVGPAGVHSYPVWSYFLDQPRPFGALPASIRVWPLATAFHLLAAVSAAFGVILGREDRRVTGGLLVLGALATLSVALGLAGRVAGGLAAGGSGEIPVVLPLATVASLAVVAVAYRRDLTNIVAA